MQLHPFCVMFCTCICFCMDGTVFLPLLHTYMPKLRSRIAVVEEMACTCSFPTFPPPTCGCTQPRSLPTNKQSINHSGDRRNTRLTCSFPTFLCCLSLSLSLPTCACAIIASHESISGDPGVSGRDRGNPCLRRRARRAAVRADGGRVRRPGPARAAPGARKHVSIYLFICLF